MNLPELNSQSLSELAYKELRAAIVRGDLQWGDKITERGLAAELGVSPTPVREALRRLEQEQLVERTGPRSLRVAMVSAQARTEGGTIEAALEGVAARFAAQKATPAQLDGIRQVLDDADDAAARLRSDRDAGRDLNPDQIERIFNAVRGFHDRVELAADNAQLTRTLTQVRAFSRSERLRVAAANLNVGGSPGQIQRYGQHRQIFQALLDGDADLAERLARAHSASSIGDLVGWNVSEAAHTESRP